MSSDLFSEKYCPPTLNGFLGQEHIIKRIKAYIENGSIPHMIFHGRSGLGKSTLKYIIRNELYKGLPQYAIDRNYQEVDASSQESRGIDSIKSFRAFCGIAPIQANFKIYAFEEFEQLTKDAKKALKEALGEGENSVSDVVRVIGLTNDINRVDDALRGSKGGRMEEFHFRPVDLKLIAQRLWYINKKENFNSSKEDIIKIAKLADGSPRSALRIYQSFTLSGEIHNIEELEYSTNPLIMVNYALDGKIQEANKVLNQILYTDGINAYKLISDISSLIRKTGIKNQHPSITGRILDRLFEYQWGIVGGTQTDTTIGSLLGYLADMGYSNKKLIEGLKSKKEKD